MLLFFSSCTPKIVDPVKAEAVGGNVSLDKPITTEGTGEEKSRDETSTLSVIGEPEGKDFLLFHETSLKAVFPEDFEIGPLQSILEMDDTESLIYRIATDFLASLLANSPDSKLISSGRRDFVMRNLNDRFEDMQLTAYRIGIINIDSEPVRADLRFIDKNGFLEGTMYFIREGSWMVYDLQLKEFLEVGKEKVTNEKWFPLYNKVDF